MTLAPPALIKNGPLTPQDFGATGDGANLAMTWVAGGEVLHRFVRLDGLWIKT